jgi:hypothetical protein
MARGRLISRTLGSSRRFSALHSTARDLAEFAQSLYPLLVACSDDFGRQSGDAFTVKHAVFPSSPRPEEDFARALQSMEAAGLIRWYAANGSQVIEIVDFEEHQPGLHKRTKSKFPGNFPEIPSEEKRTEQKRTEPKGVDELRARFDRFWDSYPRKVGKDAAWGEFKKRTPGDDLTDAMIAAVTLQRASAQWQKEGGQYIPNPRTWLHQGRWEDEPIAAARTSRDTGVDWFEECKQIHHGECGLDRMRHHTRKQIEAARRQQAN